MYGILTDCFGHPSRITGCHHDLDSMDLWNATSLLPIHDGLADYEALHEDLHTAQATLCSIMSQSAVLVDATEPPNLPEFLAEGLVPYTFPDDESVCTICLHEYTQAIQIRKCGHAFDLECLSSWFSSSTKPTTCPMCRQELFQRNNLGEVLRRFAAPGFELNTFGLPTPTSIEIPHIAPLDGFLIPTILSVDEAVTTTIDMSVVTTALILAGNTAIIVAELNGTPIHPDELADFGHIVRAMHSYLSKRNQSSMSVQELPTTLVIGISAELEAHGVELETNLYIIDDLSELEDHPAKRAVQMAFFLAWVLWRRSDGPGQDASEDVMDGLH